MVCRGKPRRTPRPPPQAPQQGLEGSLGRLGLKLALEGLQPLKPLLEPLQGLRTPQPAAYNSPPDLVELNAKLAQGQPQQQHSRSSQSRPT